MPLTIPWIDLSFFRWFVRFVLIFKREKELAAVQINAEDVEVIAAEFALDKKVAERRLRENKGDLEAALKSYLE